MNNPKEEQDKFSQNTEKSNKVLLSLLNEQQIVVNELRASQLKYESLFENSPVSLWEEDLSAIKNYIDQNFPDKSLFEDYLNKNPDKIAYLTTLVKVVNINQATLKLYKSETKEQLFNNFSKIFTINSFKVFKNLLINLCNSVYEYETESINKNFESENLYIKLKYSVVTGYEQTWERIIISVINITQEKEFKDKLMQSEQRNIEAQSIARYGNWHIDYKTNLITRSKEIYNIIGLNETELKPTFEAFTKLIHKDDIEEYNEIFNNAIKTQKSYQHTFRIITPKGETKYILEKGYTFFDEKNEPLRTVGTAQDITENFLTEIKLKESQLQYHVLFDSAPIALFEEDFTEVIKKLNDLGANEENIHLLLEDPTLLLQCLQLVFVNNINQEALKLFKVNNKKDFHQFLPNLFTKNAIEVVKSIFIDITNGKSNGSYETLLRMANGEVFNAIVRYSILKFKKDAGKLIFSVENVTSQKKLLIDIEEKQLSLNQAQQIALIGSFTLNHEDNSIVRTDEFYRIFEASQQELPTREECFLNFVHPDDSDRIKALFHNAIKEKIPYDTTYRITTAKGHLKYIHEKGNTYYNDKGIPTKTIGTLQDITDKVLFENELNLSRKTLEKTYQLLENTLNDMTDGFVTLSKDWIYTYVNPKAAKLLNKTIEELKGKYIWDVFPDGINKLFHQNCIKTFENQVPLIYEEFYVETQHWFENRLFPTSEGISIFFQDITDKKNVLKKIEEAHSVIINSNSIAIIWENIPTWPVKYVSDNIERILGYSADEMINEIIHFSKIMHPDDLDFTNNEAISYLNNPEIESYKLTPYRVFTKNGKIRWITERTNVIRNIKGEAIEIRGFIDDITEQYLLENAINTILSSVSKVTGNEYLKEITIQLSNILEAEHTFIGLIDKENPSIINTIYNCFKGNIVENFSYNLIGTPCFDILNYEVCSIEKRVTQLYPDDLLLVEMEIEGYVGVPLIDSNNKPIGIMVGLYKKPIENPNFSESIIQLFSTRTSAEIERLKVEEQLKETESAFNKQLQKLNIAINAINDVVFMTNTDGIFTYINDAFTKLYGYQAQELIGLKTPRILKSGLLPNDFYKNLWVSLFQKNKIIKEIKNKTKDGKLIDIESSISSINNNEGTIIGFISIQRDITEKIYHNQLLAQSEKKYHDLFEKTKDATLLIKDGLFIDCNESTLKMVGFKGDKEDFLYIHPSKLSPTKQPDGRLSKEKADVMMAIALKKGSHQYEWVHLKSNGEEFYAEITLTKVETLDENILHCVWRDITEKKKAEAQLKASEAEAWSLFEDATYPIWIEDFSQIKIYFDQLRQNGITNINNYLDQNPNDLKKIADLITITKVNNSSLAFYEVETKEELFRNISDFFVTESYESFKEEIIALFEGQLTYKSELIIRKLNGQLAHIIVTASVPYIYKDTLEKVIISFIDVSEQKRNEKTNEILLNITKQISDVTSIKDFCITVKEELKCLLDTSNFYIALYNKDKDTISIPYYADELDTRFKNNNEYKATGTITGYVIKNKKPLLANLEIYKKLGLKKIVGADSQIWLGVPLFNKDEVIGAIAVQSYTNPNAYTQIDLKLLEFVSEKIAIAIDRIQHQNAIKESEEKFRSIFELSPDMFIVLNRNGIIIDCNTTTLKKIQYTNKNQLIGRSINDVFRKGINQNAVEVFHSIIEDSYTKNKELQFIQNDGNFITVEVSGTVIKSEKLEDYIIVGVARDITERKKHEIELNLALEKAKESDRLKSAFLANMSHEIRTPMNGILGFAEMLQKQDLNEDKRSFYANIIMNSSRQLLHIINDVLDMSIIEAGLVEIKKAPVSINVMLRELHEFFIQKSDEKQLKLTCNLSLNDELSVINTDPTKVQQVLTNFISNAIKFTKNGEVAFGYTLKDNYLEFYVSDTGIGIDKKLHHEIFERFRQVNLEYTRETIGNGLGLSITKRLVELLGGAIWLESEPNKGSTFYFTLPYQHDILNITNEYQTPILPKTMNKKITILLAEDEEYNRIYIEEILDDKNFTILTAENGVEAVDIAKNNPNIMFVLMDIKMPIMNGIDALKLIREFNKTVPIIALTAFSMESDKKHLLNEGFDDYVAKPIVKKDLMQILDKYVTENNVK